MIGAKKQKKIMKDAQYWIEKLDLQKHPEGGYYKETYRSSDLINYNCTNDRYKGDRNYATAIYFIITSDDFSAFHRLKSDEILHFYTGSSATIHIIDLDGNYFPMKLGSNLAENEFFQVIIKAGNWFGVTVNNSNSFSLFGATVAPGFDFQDFELGKREDLLKLYPQHNLLIKKLTKK